MRQFSALLLILLYCLGVALGLYEVTAKAPDICGLKLPGWRAGQRAERLTAWRERTGFLPVDHLLHESEEAVRFYAYLLDRPPIAGRFAVPDPIEVSGG